jgi:hypothetical protein
MGPRSGGEIDRRGAREREILKKKKKNYLFELVISLLCWLHRTQNDVILNRKTKLF